MKRVVLGVLVAFVGSLGAAPPARAKCEALYAAAQALIRQAEDKKKDPQTLEGARRCAKTGIKHHRQGWHWESMKTLRQCLKMLED